MAEGPLLWMWGEEGIIPLYITKLEMYDDDDDNNNNKNKNIINNNNNNNTNREVGLGV